MNRLRAGFTLVEILVVVGIILVLMTLFIPTARSVMDGSNGAHCLNNLRQIGLAFQLYWPDHNNTMPQRVYPFSAAPGGSLVGYDELLLPYTGDVTRIFQCKSHRPKDYPDEPSYGMNWYFDNAHLGTVTNFSQTILAAETRGDHGTGSHRADRDSISPGQLATSRHSGRANYLFFDGHAEVLSFAATLDLWGADQGMHDNPTPQ